MARRLIAPFAAVLALLLLVAPVSAHPFPARIDLPDGWAPEGITAGRGNIAYVGSLADGAIARVNLRSGDVSPLAAGAPGRVTVGVDYERGRHRIWAAGGATSEVRAYDARSGALLQTYHLTTGFLNDVVVTRRAVYVTDSNLQQLIVVPLGRHGRLPDPSAAFVLPLTGDIQYGAGFNANGIVASRGWLILVQSNTGQLFRVNPRTGETREIDLGGASVSSGDGLEVVGSRLFVGRNSQRGRRVPARRPPGLGAAGAGDHVAGPRRAHDVAFSAGRLWVVNARFNTLPTPTTAYWITRLR